MDSFFSKAEYTQKDIEVLIRSKAEESLYLEFKSAGSLAQGDNKKIEIAKDVSAFANSEGGIIIYGLQEDNHTASEPSFIDGGEFSKEWLENVLDSRIQRRISGKRIIPVRFNEDLSKTVYIVKIPQSYNAPHMVENRFYKRRNFQRVPMEEYEVRDTYNRRLNSQLKIGDIITDPPTANKNGNKISELKYTMRIQLINIGNSIDTLYKLELMIPRNIRSLDKDNPINPFFIQDKGEYLIYSIPNQSPLFQGEETTLGAADIKLTRNTFLTLQKLEVLAKLYYSNGSNETRFNLYNILNYEGKPLKEWEWI